MTTTLPNKLSELLRLSVHDAQLCEKDPRYILDMEIWHTPILKDDNTCHVCMAGAVMAKTLSYPAHINVCVDETSYSEKLFAINYMRMGAFESALRMLELPLHDLGLCGYGSKPYNAVLECEALLKEYGNRLAYNFRAPWDVYLKCADMLEEVGL